MLRNGRRSKICVDALRIETMMKVSIFLANIFPFAVIPTLNLS
jgi:hypothetical protein